MSPIKIKKITKKLEELFKEIEKEEGVLITLENVKDSGLSFRTVICIKENDEKSRMLYEMACRKVGFTQNVIGMKFEGTNGIYEITDIKPNSRRYPVIAKSPSGDTYKYTVAHIKKLIGGDKIINRNANLDKLVGE